MTSSKDNPVLNIIRDGWDSSDPWGSAMAALIDLQDLDFWAGTEELAKAGVASWTHAELSALRVEAGLEIELPSDDPNDDTYHSLPEWATNSHSINAWRTLSDHEWNATRIIDRIESVARANGLNY